MKTFKKALSVILCLCMIMSVMAAGGNALSQGEGTAPAGGAPGRGGARTRRRPLRGVPPPPTIVLFLY